MSDVCLLITTWNRTPLLENNLRRLASGLTLPSEVLVVDDGSVDACEARCTALRDELGLPLRYIYTHNPGEALCSHARNVGIKNTDCELILTSEPEMLFESDIVAQMVAQHEHDRQWGIRQFVNVGRVFHEQPPGARCKCCGQLKHETVNWQATWITLYRREWLFDVGGWDEFGFEDVWGWDDVDLGSRLRIRGIGQYNALDMVATHQWHPPRICRQDRNEAYFKSKGFDGNENPNHPNVVANRGCEWGVVKWR